jgi:hypothetical protein
MTTETEKHIPAAYLRSQEFARQKQAREQKKRERRQARHERVTQRLAAVLGEITKEVRMDEQHPERIYLKEGQLEKFYQLSEQTRQGSLAATYALWSWLRAALAIEHPQVKEGRWAIGYEDDDVMRAYIEPWPAEGMKELSRKKNKLEQELAQVNAQLRQPTIDELKAKLLTVMTPGETVTVTKDAPAAPKLELVKDAPAPEGEDAPAHVNVDPGAPPEKGEPEGAAPAAQ